MKIFNAIRFGCIFIAISQCNYAFSHAFDGEWEWGNAPSSRTFFIDIKQTGNRLRGQYCAVARNGNRTDCDDDHNPNLRGYVEASGQSAIVIFSSFFGAKNGRAELKIQDDKLIWRIMKNPIDGEFYAPGVAILRKR